MLNGTFTFILSPFVSCVMCSISSRPGTFYRILAARASQLRVPLFSVFPSVCLWVCARRAATPPTGLSVCLWVCAKFCSGWNSETTGPKAMKLGG